MKYVIGLINGGGTGPELVRSVKKVIESIKNVFGLSFEVIDFDNQTYKKEVNVEKWDKRLYDSLTIFYQDIGRKDGAVLSGSLPAPVLYDIRKNLSLDTKLCPLNPYPEHSIKPEFDVLLVRQNSLGVYHLDFTERQEDKVIGTFHYSAGALQHLAEVSFLEAMKRRKKVALVLKASVLGEIGEIWREVFEDVRKQYADVEFSVRPSGAGFSDMLLFPKQFDVVVTDDEGGDIIADVVPTILYNTRNLVPALNLRRGGFCVYQTDHGTVKCLTGQNKMNPIGMLTALCMALEYSYNLRYEAMRLKTAINETLSQGCRTKDMYEGGRGQRLLGTREITDKIIENL